MTVMITIRKDPIDLYCSGFRYVIRRAFRTALKAEGVDVPCMVEVLMTDDMGIHMINRDMRGVDRPTDVLSFPEQQLIPEHFDADACEADPETGIRMLGNMAVSVDRIRAQAEEYGHSAEQELAYLTVHSCLHLLGYDHLDEGPMKAQMRRREKAIMALMGYEED